MKKAVAWLEPWFEAERQAGQGRSQARMVIATVKGDVHDIGKNIVGVVLRCNNFDVIDLGVMVSAQRILDEAREHKADLIGLSGLITPSLEEMSHVARELQRQGFDCPLLIGGATTSRAHTALKIEPHYRGPTVWVKDASRAVGVAQKLMSRHEDSAFLDTLRGEYADIRARHASRGEGKRLISLEQARARRYKDDWHSYHPVQPAVPGLTVLDDVPLRDLIDVIDWTPFFQTWELSGRYPQILDDAVVGAQARELFADAKAMLERIVDERWLRARAVIGFWPADSVGDDIEILDPQGHVIETLCCLRQQADKPVERPNLSLADFVAPRGSGQQDWIGAFAVTAGIGIDEHVQRFEADNDDYNSILLKALADRLAEALAEHMHRRVRTHYWGYAADEALDNEALIAEKYRGIRPAPGYPACPEHSEKEKLFRLLDAPVNAGMELTESYAMSPASSVSGWYFSHPQSQYFVVGRIGKEQVEDYARRKHWSLSTAERWLATILDYDPV